jgi:hypothetical protein
MQYLLYKLCFVSLALISNASKIDGDYANRSSHLCRPKESISSFDQLCKVKLQSTAHTSHGSWSIRIWIFLSDRISMFIFFCDILWSYKVLEVGDTIFGCHDKYFMNHLIISRKLFGDIVCWDRECKYSSFCIPMSIDLNQSLVDDTHFRF